MILSFHPCFSAHQQIVLGDRALNKADLEAIQRADAVILPQARSENFVKLCLRAGKPTFPNYEMRYEYRGKVGQTKLFDMLQLPHPESACFKDVEAFKSDVHEDLNFPSILKDNLSHEAHGIFMVTDSASLDAALEQMALRQTSENRGFVIQRLIPTSGNVLRAVIIGQKIVTYWKRPHQEGQFITTISRGARIDRDWKPTLQEQGRHEAQILARKTGINLAAVDFVFDFSTQNPVPLFLEINYYFGRRGLGGMEAYYGMLYRAIQEWLTSLGLNPGDVQLL